MATLYLIGECEDTVQSELFDSSVQPPALSAQMAVQTRRDPAIM
jgi:hypothetical protein